MWPFPLSVVFGCAVQPEMLLASDAGDQGVGVLNELPSDCGSDARRYFITLIPVPDGGYSDRLDALGPVTLSMVVALPDNR